MSEENDILEPIPPEQDGEIDELLDEPVETQETEEGETENGTADAVIDLSVEARLLRARIILQNASGNPSISAALLPYGYDETKFDEGWALYDAAKALSDTQKELWAARIGAYSRFRIEFNALNNDYIVKVKVSRIFFEGDAGVFELLQLGARRERRLAKLIDQMRRFYANALKAEIVGTFTDNGVTVASLNDRLEHASTVEKLYGVYKDKRSLAQQATIDRNAALDVMETWLRVLLAFAQAALEGDEQLLESLLLLVRTPRTASKDRQKTSPRYPAPPLDMPPIGIINP